MELNILRNIALKLFVNSVISYIFLIGKEQLSNGVTYITSPLVNSCTGYMMGGGRLIKTISHQMSAKKDAQRHYEQTGCPVIVRNCLQLRGKTRNTVC